MNQGHKLSQEEIKHNEDIELLKDYLSQYTRARRRRVQLERRLKAICDEMAAPVTQPGDVWQLGDHRLICGDALDFSDIGILMGGELADLILTDPPYNVDYEAKDKALERSYKRNTTRKNNEIKNDRMNEDAFYEFLYKAFGNCYDAARDCRREVYRHRRGGAGLPEIFCSF